MYIYESAVVKINFDWEEKDIRFIPVDVLYATYQEVRVRVSHFAMSNIEEFVLTSVTEFVHYPKFIDDLLTELGEQSLPTYYPTTDVKRQARVEYRNSGLAGYVPKPCVLEIPGDMVLDRSACNDILVPPLEGTSVTSLYEGCIFSVGGRVHRAYLREDGVVLKDGLTTLSATEDDSIGLINLGVFGKVSYLNIDANSLKTASPIANNFSELVYIGDENLDFTKHYVFLVIAGILTQFNFTEVIGQNLLKVNTTGLPLLHLYLQSKDVFDFTELREVIKEDNNESLPMFLSNEGIGALFKDPSTFIILVEKEEGKDLCLSYEHYPHSGVRGLYRTEVPPSAMLFNTAGIMANYVTVPNNDLYSVSTNDDLVTNWLMAGKEQPNGDKVISTARERLKPTSYSDLAGLNYYYLY